MPRISVIVPAHNEEAFLDNCLKSLIAQNYPKESYEIIVIDNASTDATSTTAKKYPVTLIREPRRSVVLARQAGFNKSRGSVIVSADADTVYPSHWLSIIDADFSAHPEAVAVIGNIYYSGVPFWFNSWAAFGQRLNYLQSRFTRHSLLVFAANFSFRRSALLSIGGYPTHLPELGDQQYLLNKFQKTGPVIVEPRAFCTTSGRRHQGRISAIFKYNFWYRLVGYTVNRLTGRQLIGPAPAIRTSAGR